MLELECQSGATLFEGFAVFDGGGSSLVEDAALTAVDCLLASRVVHLLEHAGHREDEVGLEAGELLEQRRQVRRVGDGDLGVESAEGDRPREYVGKRQEHQSLLAGDHGLRHRQAAGVGLGVEVGVRQLDTLGASGGSGGVDQGRGRGSGDLVTTSVQFFVGDCRTATGQLVDRTRLDDKNLAEGFCAVGDFLVSLRVLGRFDDQKCRR